jgi:hypothetical protein
LTYHCNEEMTNNILIASLLDLPRLLTKPTNWPTSKTQATCHVDGLNKGLKHLTKCAQK